MSQQSRRQASVRDRANTAGTLEGDWHALFDAASIATGPIDGRMIAYLQRGTGLTIGDINGLKNAYARQRGVQDWSSLGRFNGIYVDADNGDDTDAGTSADRPLKTLATATPLLSAGRTLWLRRGATWREQLTITGLMGTGSDPIAIRSWGDDTDQPPAILGSYRVSGSWAQVTGTEYGIAVSTAPVNVFHVIDDSLDRATGAVVKLEPGVAGSLTPGQWAHSGGQLRININADPTGERIEVPRGVEGVDTIRSLLVDGLSAHVEIEGVRCLFAKDNGVEVQGASTDIVLRNTDCNWSGSDGIGVHGNGTHLICERNTIIGNGRERTLTGSYGDGISFHDLSLGEIRHCVIEGNQKSGIGNTGTPSVTAHGNYIKGNNANVRIFNSNGGRLDFTYNIVIRTDDDDTGIAALWIGDSSGAGFEFFGYNNTIVNHGSATGIVDGIRALDRVSGLWLNNVVQGFVEGIDHRADSFRGDFNCYRQNGADYAGTMEAGSHDITADPDFVDAAGEDFRPNGASPLIAAGVSRGMTADYLGNSISTPPTIGAIEARP